MMPENTSTANERTYLLNDEDNNRESYDPSGIQTPVEADVEAGGSAGEAEHEATPLQLAAIILPMSIGVFLVAMDSTLLVSSYAAIGSDFNELQRSSWVATGYMLTVTCFQPLYGKLSDIFGRKSCLISAYIIFALGAAFCGLARSMNELIAARVLAGVGGGGISTVGSIVMSDVVPLRKRGTWQGLQSIMIAVGSSAGAPLGGILTDTIGWRWSFLIQVPITLVAILVVAFALKIPSPSSSKHQANGNGASERQTLWTKIKRIDFLGALTLIIAITAILLALDRGSTTSSWSSPFTLISFAISAVFTVLLLVIEWHFASEPFAPKEIMTRPSLLANYAINFFSTASMMAMTYQLPLYLQAVKRFSAGKTGVWMVPGVIGGVGGSIIGGVCIQRTGKYWWVLLGGYAVMTLGTLVITLVTMAMSAENGVVWFSTAVFLITLAVTRLGGGTSISSGLVALLANAGPENKATATAVSYLFRSLGALAGVSFGMTVMQSVLRRSLWEQLREEPDVDELIKHVVESLSYIDTLSPKIEHIVRASYDTATHAALWLAVGFVGAATVASLFVKEQSLPAGSKRR